MIFLTPYNTTACNGYVISPTIEAIKKTAVTDNSLVDNIKKSKNVWCLTDKGSFEQPPAFGQPLMFDKAELLKLTTKFGHPDAHDDRYFVVVDVRPFGKWDENKNDYIIKNRVEFNLALLRASLTEFWINGGVSKMENFSTLPMTIFASWISENVARRYNLDVREQAALATYAAYYYMGLFTAEEKISEQERTRFAATISKALRLNATEVFEILDRTEPPQTITEFCSRAEGVVGTVRLKDFNKLVLFSVIGNTWFGTNAKETVCVSLEHPPTWIALVTAAFSERGFTKSGISQLTERPSNREPGKNFTRQVFSLVQFEI